MAKKFIPIQLDRMRMFRLGPAATDVFKAVSGKAIDKVGKEGFDVKELAQLLYAGCYHEDHNLTVDKMMEIIDEFELDELGEIMTKIFPEPKGNNEGNVE